MTKERGVFYLETKAESPFVISDHRMFKNSENTSENTSDNSETENGWLKYQSCICQGKTNWIFSMNVSFIILINTWSNTSDKEQKIHLYGI